MRKQAEFGISSNLKIAREQIDSIANVASISFDFLTLEIFLLSLHPHVIKWGTFRETTPLICQISCPWQYIIKNSFLSDYKHSSESCHFVPEIMGAD
jgi:hypothetical protein